MAGKSDEQAIAEAKAKMIDAGVQNAHVIVCTKGSDTVVFTATSTVTDADALRALKDVDAARTEYPELDQKMAKHEKLLEWYKTSPYKDYVSSKNQLDFCVEIRRRYLVQFPDSDKVERVAHGILEWICVCEDYAIRIGYTEAA